jgi:hypothetical protein
MVRGSPSDAALVHRRHAHFLLALAIDIGIAVVQYFIRQKQETIAHLLHIGIERVFPPRF